MLLFFLFFVLFVLGSFALEFALVLRSFTFLHEFAFVFGSVVTEDGFHLTLVEFLGELAFKLLVQFGFCCGKLAVGNSELSGLFFTQIEFLAQYLDILLNALFGREFALFLFFLALCLFGFGFLSTQVDGYDGADRQNHNLFHNA